MRGSGQRLPITLRFTRVLGTFSHTTCFPFSCALWACFSDRSVSGERSEPMGAPMPHAALWVVQRKTLKLLQILRLVSMPHAALWVVQPYALSDWRVVGRKFQCRTRLCGWCSLFGGARWGESCYVSMPHAALWVVQHALFRPALCISLVSMPHAAIPFRPHHRFAVPLPRSRRGGLVRLRFLAESRNISFPRRCGGSGERSEPIGAPMPHAALWVVQQRKEDDFYDERKFQCRTRLCGWCSLGSENIIDDGINLFQCRTRLCGWCNVYQE